MKKSPDLVDLAFDWCKEHYPHLRYEVVESTGVTDGKVLIVHKPLKDGGDDRLAHVLNDTHIFSLSVRGVCWHHSVRSLRPDFDAKVNPFDINPFEILEQKIEGALSEN